MSKTIEEKEKEFDQKWFNYFEKVPLQFFEELDNLRKERDRIAREEELEDIGNYADALYQTGNMDKTQSEMVCEYIDEKLSTLTK